MKLAAMSEADYITIPADDVLTDNIASEAELQQAITQLESQMRDAAKKFEFERAAGLRDRIRALRQRELGGLLAAADILSATSQRDVAAAVPVPQRQAATDPAHPVAPRAADPAVDPPAKPAKPVPPADPAVDPPAKPARIVPPKDPEVDPPAKPAVEIPAGDPVVNPPATPAVRRTRAKVKPTR
jgi:hypothetical protein